MLCGCTKENIKELEVEWMTELSKLKAEDISKFAERLVELWSEYDKLSKQSKLALDKTIQLIK